MAPTMLNAAKKMPTEPKSPRAPIPYSLSRWYEIPYTPNDPRLKKATATLKRATRSITASPRTA